MIKKLIAVLIAVAGVGSFETSAPVRADVFTNIPESSAYTLVYSLAIPNSAAFNFAAIPYTVDNHLSIAPGSFSRIAYYLELQSGSGAVQYAYASVDAFTANPAMIGVPSTSTGAFLQQNVSNMNVVSNVPGVAAGSGINTGSIEFWPYDYGTENTAGVPNASSSVYDVGDRPTGSSNYGSMQINNYGARQTVLSYNDWGNREGSSSDLGLGNQVGGSNQPDWTFASNAPTFTVKNLEVLVLPNSVPEPDSQVLFGAGLAGLGLLRRRRLRGAKRRG